MNTKNFNNNESYIKYGLSGTCSSEEIENIPKIIKEQCEHTDIWKVLLDTTGIESKIINTMLQFYWGERIANILKGKVHLAVYGNGEIFTKFTETVAVNRGACVKVSSNYKELVSWLNN